MRLLPLLAVTALACAAFVVTPVVRADTPLRPPEKHVARSPSQAIEAESDPAPSLTTISRVAPDGTRTRLWAMNGWYRAIYPADDGEHVAIGFDGLNLLPGNAADELVVLRFVRRGEVIAVLTLHDVVPDRSILRGTASHLAWRQGEGIDTDGHFLVITMDGVKHHYDMTTGRPLDSRPPTGTAIDLEPPHRVDDGDVLERRAGEGGSGLPRRHPASRARLERAHRCGGSRRAGAREEPRDPVPPAGLPPARTPRGDRRDAALRPARAREGRRRLEGREPAGGTRARTARRTARLCRPPARGGRHGVRRQHGRQDVRRHVPGRRVRDVRGDRDRQGTPLLGPRLRCGGKARSCPTKGAYRFGTEWNPR